MEYYSAIKKEGNNAICSNMGATRESPRTETKTQHSQK